MTAAAACGLLDDDGGERGVRATIRSGLDAGERNPRQPSTPASRDRTPTPAGAAGTAGSSGGADAPTDAPTANLTADRGPHTTSHIPRRLPIVSASTLLVSNPQMRPPLIHDLLRRGETMNVVAAPKVGKSWLVHALAVAAATGGRWLGFGVERCRVLLVDAELHPETLARRLRVTCEAAGVDPASLDGWLDTAAVRGARWTIDDLHEATHSIDSAPFGLVIADALYRFLPIDGEENANETMVHIYNALDAIAARLNASVVVVHHTSKGSQHGKSVTDVGSGAGAQSRAADTHLIARPHEAERAIVVEAVVRSFPSPTPFCARWLESGGWELAPDLDPSAIAGSRRNRGRADAEPREPLRQWTPADFAAELVRAEPETRDAIIDRAVTEHGLSRRAAGGLLSRAVDDGRAFRHVSGSNHKHRFATVPQVGLVGDGVAVGGVEGAAGAADATPAQTGPNTAAGTADTAPDADADAPGGERP